ncbi:transketolase [Salibacterium halotolerans]|uniref:Transketolase n=1 Tax=Salibacterium halotolerans TaxID=1884432 RepID=A0A1I5PMT7_9BACI|nr:hypothetical protein [Salibacterium halotolerans]SFP35364.1 transketolase [Salibacterium halotolerans]
MAINHKHNSNVSIDWYKYVGSHGTVYEIDRFGASAPGGEVVEKYGFEPEGATEAAWQLIKR